MKEQRIIFPVESTERRAERARRVADFLARLDGAKPWELLLKQWTKPRTGRQNNAMWGPIYGPFSAYTGYTEPELHDLMCRAYFGEVEDEALGMRRIRPRRTTTTNERGERDLLSREAMSDFFAFVMQKAAEVGCYIEDPNPMLRTRAA